MDSPVHSLVDASSRDNLRNHKNVTEEEKRLKIISGKVLRTSSYTDCNYAEEHLEDDDVMLKRIFGNVPKRSRYTKYVNVSPTDGYKFEKRHFVKGMSATTPTVHRKDVHLQPRPLSPIVLPCLQRHLLKSISLISNIFPSSATSSKVTYLSFGSAIPLVNRPQLLLLGDEGVGLDHLGPAILHELAHFPIHWLRHPSLLSGLGAKTPDKALVRIFNEAKRTTPSILYIPRINEWWEIAYKQLRDLFLTLLEELPSDLPILLLATSHGELSDMEEQSVFDNLSVYAVDKPSREDRSLCFDRLIESALSVIPNVPKAPTGPKPAETVAEKKALAQLRKHLRAICYSLSSNKLYRAFRSPVREKDAPVYCSIIKNPMDITTLMQRVNAGQYLTCSPFLDDVDLILKNAKAFYGNDYSTTQIVFKAYALRDEVSLMLSEIDPALRKYCDKIAAQSGPKMQSDLSGSVLGCLAPVVDIVTVSTSAPQPQFDSERESGPKEPNKTADRIQSVKVLLMEHSENYGIPQLEKLYTQIMRGVHKTLDQLLHADVNNRKHASLRFLSEFAQNQANF